MKRILAFFKKETVLCVSFILAVVSMFIVPPDKEYWGYIDFRTLAILFCLMSVMAGFQKAGVFDWIAKKLLGHVRSGRGLILTLVLLCFFSGMFITNDVALITFVPFTFIVLGMLGDKQKDRLVLPVVVMQTIAANLGSMLTPVGNPQNLYLYGRAGLSIREFLMLMMPYTLLSLVLLVVWSLIQGRACPQALESGEASVQDNFPQGKKAVYPLVVYLMLFLLCLLAVGHILPWQAALVAVIIMVLVTDRQVFARVDYFLLLTFAGFFVFVGNVGRIPAFRDFLQDMIAGREVYTAIIVSQIISNVPAALLLSGFTENLEGLIVGTNLGGLGTLIASMASLISYKYVAKETSGCKSKYIVLFTVGNIFFLAALVLLNVLLGNSMGMVY
ncbi:MAG: anion permease [Acetatifactor sp.]|nr:anion permease [Acetatifactor sp.]